MTKFLRHLSRITLTGATLLLPIAVWAQSVNPVPIVEGTEIQQVIYDLAIWAATLAGAIAVAFLIYGGFIYITGGEKGAEKAKPVIVNAIIGLFIIALAFVIINTVVGALSRL